MAIPSPSPSRDPAPSSPACSRRPYLLLTSRPSPLCSLLSLHFSPSPPNRRPPPPRAALLPRLRPLPRPHSVLPRPRRLNQEHRGASAISPPLSAGAATPWRSPATELFRRPPPSPSLEFTSPRWSCPYDLNHRAGARRSDQTKYGAAAAGGASEAFTSRVPEVDTAVPPSPGRGRVPPVLGGAPRRLLRPHPRAPVLRHRLLLPHDARLLHPRHLLRRNEPLQHAPRRRGGGRRGGHRDGVRARRGRG